MSKLEVVKNYQSRSKEYNFNWCWHRTLPLKKKRFSIFENLLKTSGTTTKVLSCLKIPLTSMRFIASCENVVPRFQTSPILPFPPHTWTVLLIPLKKLFYSQCWRVLKCSSKQTHKACVKDATSYSFVRNCEKLRMWISHLVIYMKMLFHRCGHRLSLIASSKSLMRIRNGFNLNWLGDQ